ncbi:hypothetical protein [Bradyrhizobium sp. Ai1a-2]|uniref:hypothetical protein n=1 Tax=Bradyrhizobium sp. Ai1a-2 TaxID=196490 RepID=UPI0019178C09|nr:hypothetical protein [Bradyrhizobium sp. Ai1a-2]
MARVLALTVRVLLLLAGLAAAALLLLTGLLARILILLTRVLVLIGHRNLPGLNLVHSDQAQANAGTRTPFRREPSRHGEQMRDREPTAKLPLYKPLMPQLALLPPKGFHC